MVGGDLTRLLAAAGGNDRQALERLYEAVYGELRRLARAQMRREGRAITLQPTLLVNEAYLRLAPPGTAWQNRAHFFAAAAEAMRRILVDHARRRRAHKRGGDAERVTLAGLEVAAEADGAAGETDVLAVDAALAALALEKPRLADLVKLRFFGGLSIEDAASALDISPATAKRDWAYARAWLKDRLAAQPGA
ncbi:MAG: ECF-type sigma factor [Steroidobacteraceae bacterium]